MNDQKFPDATCVLWEIATVVCLNKASESCAVFPHPHLLLFTASGSAHGGDTEATPPNTL